VWQAPAKGLEKFLHIEKRQYGFIHAQVDSGKGSFREHRSFFIFFIVFTRIGGQ
jgi:hypothetical protein